MVSLQLNARRDSAALVRGVLDGLADVLTLDPTLLDDVKTAVSEACNNAVEHAYAEESGKVAVRIDIAGDHLEVNVRDWGGGFKHVAAPENRMRMGLPLINALADRAEFLSAPNRGTEVRMTFGFRGDAPRPQPPTDFRTTGEIEAWQRDLTGDVVLTIPVTLVPRVLGRLARTLAASAQFSLERFSDLYLITEAIAGYAREVAGRPAISLSLALEDRRLVLTVGPLRPALQRNDELAERRRQPLRQLADDLALEPVDGSQVLRVTVVDQPGDSTASHG